VFSGSSNLFSAQLEAQLADRTQLAAAGQLSDGLKMDLEEAQKKLATEQEAKAKLMESNQVLQKV
jgi:hypothetical protein